MLLLDLCIESVSFLLFVSVLIFDEGKLTLHFHSVVDMVGKLVLIFLFFVFNFVPGLVLDLFALFFVICDHLLDLL